jgi:hypothetical protein
VKSGQSNAKQASGISAEFQSSPTLSSVYQLLHDNITHHNEQQHEQQKSHDETNKVQIFPLNWSEGVKDITNRINESNHSNTPCVEYYLVVGTDVLFDPSLVLPLLNAASILTKTVTGSCIFCMQIRCKDSHQVFLEHVTDYFDTYCDISEDVYITTGCAWGRYVECFMFEMKGGKKKATQQRRFTTN